MYEAPPGIPNTPPYNPQDQISAIVNTNAAAILNNHLWIRLVVGDADLGQRNGNNALDAQLTSCGIPHEYEPALTGVGHDWGDYYRQNGEYGLNFHLNCFVAAGAYGRTAVDTYAYLPAIYRDQGIFTLTPTATATNTPIPPTATNTATPIPPTATHTATPTQTSTPAVPTCP